jgi:hypothetical protein
VTSESEELEVDPALEVAAEAVMDASDRVEAVAEWTFALEDAGSSLRIAARVLA